MASPTGSPPCVPTSNRSPIAAAVAHRPRSPPEGPARRTAGEPIGPADRCSWKRGAPELETLDPLERRVPRRRHQGQPGVEFRRQISRRPKSSWSAWKANAKRRRSGSASWPSRALWRATALPAGEKRSPAIRSRRSCPISPLGRFLFDPDPALVRAGLIDLFASRSGLPGWTTKKNT